MARYRCAPSRNSTPVARGSPPPDVSKTTLVTWQLVRTSSGYRRDPSALRASRTARMNSRGDTRTPSRADSGTWKKPPSRSRSAVSALASPATTVARLMSVLV
ncbi:hypothetical protein CDD83_9456 [Cordyceps sp. RAO-2017]|nr:hypothetical protein CDD83_9456 [Cordyceps sp. RAO-2017]